MARKEKNDEVDGDEAPGWAAIDRALAPVHGKLKPLHFAATPHFAAGGADPLDGISFYRVSTPPHWHVVTYGLSELYGKESDDAGTSGFGFELTFRLARRASDRNAPAWVFNFLQNLARYVFKTGNRFAATHHMDCRGPIALGTGTAIVAITFAQDPTVKPFDTPHGRLELLQVVGITRDEYEAVLDWDTEAFQGLLAQRDPLLVTDLARRSVLADPKVAATVRARTRAEGSSMGGGFVGHVVWKRAKKKTRIEVGATAVPTVRRALVGRLPFDRTMTVVGPDGAFELAPSKRGVKVSEREGLLHVALPVEQALALAERLAPKRGSYAVDETLELVVVPSEIKDQQGKTVEIIG